MSPVPEIESFDVVVDVKVVLNSATMMAIEHNWHHHSNTVNYMKPQIRQTRIRN